MYIQPKDLSHETWLLCNIGRIICGISLQSAICEVWVQYNIMYGFPIMI